jgi:hypothetical protein
MIFKNYCLILLGKFDRDLAFEELSKISEIKINYIYTNGVYIATFSTIMTPKEMKNLLQIGKNNYFIFELNEDVSYYNLEDKEIEAGLFNLLNNINLGEMSKNFIDDLKEEPKEGLYYDKNSDDVLLYDEKLNANKKNKKKFEKINLVDFINTLNDEDKEGLMNELIDKGVDKLTELDKKLLNLLSK